MSTPLSAVRRIIVYALLFALVTISASGISGLLTRALDSGTVLAGSATAGLALSLAFAVIAGPLAALLAWLVWRRLGDPAERESLGWSLYIAALYGVSLITASSQLLALASGLVQGRTEGWNGFLATGAVWAGVWVWHRWMWRHRSKGPLRLSGVPTALGTAYGLVLGAVMGAVALSRLFETAVRVTTGTLVPPLAGPPDAGVWWRLVLASATWAAGGLLVWSWHWYRERGRVLPTRLNDVALIVVGIFGGSVAALGGAGTVLFVVLRLLFDRDPAEAPAILLEPLPLALAAGVVGWLVWGYHRPLVLRRSEAAVQAARLVTSGVALVGAASGIGVIINAALSLATPRLAGTSALTLLLGGIASLAVGGPVWWLVWKPTSVMSEPVAVRPAGRRVYLVVIFGASAVAALVTLLVIGYQIFQSLLSGGEGGFLIARIRAPLGVLVATALAAGYHFAVWRHDRTVLAGLHSGGHAIGRAILVTSLDPEPLSRAITEATGAGVTVWRRAGGVEPAVDGAVGAPPQPEAGPTAEDVAKALEGLVAKRVLVLVGPGGRVEAVPLEG